MTRTPAGDERQVRRQRSEGRRRRNDYGSFRASERDSELLYLIGEQYAVTLPQLARLIGRRLHTARALRDRWKRAGWINSRPLAVDAPSFVWLTGRGRTIAQSPYRSWDANPGLAHHIQAVTNLRLLLEHDLQLGDWESERSIAQRLTQEHGPRNHLPDSILTSNNNKVADRGRTDPQKPRPPPNDRRRAQPRLRPRLVLRTRTAPTNPDRTRRRRPLRQPHRPPLPAARRRDHSLSLAITLNAA